VSGIKSVSVAGIFGMAKADLFSAANALKGASGALVGGHEH
jgi:hypothetical protein